MTWFTTSQNTGQITGQSTGQSPSERPSSHAEQRADEEDEVSKHGSDTVPNSDQVPHQDVTTSALDSESSIHPSTGQIIDSSTNGQQTMQNSRFAESATHINGDTESAANLSLQETNRKKSSRVCGDGLAGTYFTGNTGSYFSGKTGGYFTGSYFTGSQLGVGARMPAGV
jgi:hypothetical protein